MGAYRYAFALALLCLAGCDKPASTTQKPSPGDQAAAAPAAQAPAPEAVLVPAAAPATRYKCEDGSIVLARYSNSANGAVVRLDLRGRQIELPAAPSASGAKYMSKEGLDAGKSLTWWTEADSAMLIEAPENNPPNSDAGEITVNCDEAK